jgi:ribosomal protein S12 methylthiotransferase RimO
VHLVSLGCAKNLVDSERLLGEALRVLGGTPVSDPGEADLVMLNTCAFVREAAEEAVAALFDLKSRLRPGARLAVLGCLPALHGGGALADALPEADLVLPSGGYGAFPERLRELFGGGEDGAALPAGGPPPPPPAGTPGPPAAPPFESWGRALAGTPRFRAFLKIAEGCGRRCTYCLIPSIRGPQAPAPLEALAREAGALAAAGCLELTLVAQDLTAWRDGPLDLGDLCRELAGVAGIRWLRLMYLHPEALTARLLESLRDNPKVIPYLDIPFQHASPRILRAMGRGRSRPLETVRLARRIWPEAALRSTLMTGFPGEGEEEYGALRAFLEEARLDHAGFFKFSPEEGTPAAAMPGRPSRRDADRRARGLAALQRRISRDRNRARVGTEIEVLVEGPSEDAPEVFCGRGTFQAPDVDGLVYFDGERPEAGTIVRAQVLKAGDYDLTARALPVPAGTAGGGRARRPAAAGAAAPGGR